MLTSEFVSGFENRFAVGLLDGDNRLVKDAAVHLRFFAIGPDGRTGTLRTEEDMEFVELNLRDDTSVAGDQNTAFYVAHPTFDSAGQWGAEVDVAPQSGPRATVQVPFQVLAVPKSPGIGMAPPPSLNDTAATATGTICSRDPACDLHDRVIGDLLGAGRPLVVQFSTPAFCETRFCGPVLEVLLEEVPAYRDRIDFVHIEVWQDFQTQTYRPAVREWALPGEPYTFFIDGRGLVLDKLEAVFAEEELLANLEALVRT